MRALPGRVVEQEKQTAGLYLRVEDSVKNIEEKVRVKEEVEEEKGAKGSESRRERTAMERSSTHGCQGYFPFLRFVLAFASAFACLPCPCPFLLQELRGPTSKIGGCTTSW